MQVLLFVHTPYSLLLKLAEGDLPALNSQDLSSIWCFLVPLHCLLLFSESSIMGRSVTFSFRSATFFLIVFQSFLSPAFLFKTDFFSFILFLPIICLFLALKLPRFLIAIKPGSRHAHGRFSF